LPDHNDFSLLIVCFLYVLVFCSNQIKDFKFTMKEDKKNKFNGQHMSNDGTGISSIIG